MKDKTSPPNKSLLKRLGKWVLPQRQVFLFCLALLLFNSLTRVLGPVMLQQAVDRYIIPKNWHGLLTLMGSYILLLILGAIANYVEIVKLETVGQGIIANIKNTAFRHLMSLDMAYFDRASSGKLVSRIENDANAMKVLFTSVITNVLGNILIFMGMFYVMAVQYSSRLAWMILWLCPLMVIGMALFHHLVSPKLIAMRKAVADVTGYATEILQGISIVQIFGQEKQVVNELEDRSLKKYRLQMQTTILFNVFFNLLFFMESIGVVLVLWVGGHMVMTGEMTIGSLLLFIAFIRQFFIPIMFLSAQFAEFQKGMAAAVRVFDLLDVEKQITETKEPLHLSAGRVVSIEFRHVWFRYREDGEWVLKDINFYCPAGEHWALVGPTGSGKSSIINLLLHFYTPQQGEILLDGININQLSQQELRERIGLVLQDTILFPGSIRDNLVLDRHISDTHLKQAMHEMGIDDFVSQLPAGYDSELLENAVNLSAGEKQLLSVGRAFLKHPSLLILDEATSHIDPETERRIQRATGTLLQGKTALMIAHRLSTIQAADRILVLKQGQIIESGNHQKLLDKEGFYADLCGLQTI